MLLGLRRKSSDREKPSKKPADQVVKKVKTYGLYRPDEF